MDTGNHSIPMFCWVLTIVIPVKITSTASLSVFATRLRLFWRGLHCHERGLTAAVVPLATGGTVQPQRMMGAVAVANPAQHGRGTNVSVHRGGTFMEAMDSLDDQIQM